MIKKLGVKVGLLNLPECTLLLETRWGVSEWEITSSNYYEARNPYALAVRMTKMGYRYSDCSDWVQAVARGELKSVKGHSGREGFVLRKKKSFEII